MNKLLNLLIENAALKDLSIEDLKLLLGYAGNELTDKLILIQTLGKLLSSSVQESTYGSFTDANDLELFGALLTSIGGEAQSLLFLEEEVSFYLKSKYLEGVCDERDA